MNNAWSEADANAFVKAHGSERGAEIAFLAYATRLVGSQPDLAIHGGGNTSVKGMVKTLAGDDIAALFVKASGIAMETITPSGFVCLDHAYLKKLRTVPSLSDEIMAQEFRLRMLRPSDVLPSIETLMHAFIDQAAVVHTHPTAILTLTNRAAGEETIAEVLGDTVGVVPYVGSGLALGRAVADELDRLKGCRAIVAMRHGLITWGASPKQRSEERRVGKEC
jgi:rhamnose utilization protein RhaD (predicted bifunctional aldolase and dehydrogenase)